MGALDPTSAQCWSRSAPSHAAPLAHKRVTRVLCCACVSGTPAGAGDGLWHAAIGLGVAPAGDGAVLGGRARRLSRAGQPDTSIGSRPLVPHTRPLPLRCCEAPVRATVPAAARDARPWAARAHEAPVLLLGCVGVHRRHSGRAVALVCRIHLPTYALATPLSTLRQERAPPAAVSWSPVCLLAVAQGAIARLSPRSTPPNTPARRGGSPWTSDDVSTPSPGALCPIREGSGSTRR